MNSNSSPTLIFLASLPMLIILLLVSILIWISFQTGILGTADATYTLSNYVDVFNDSLFIEAISNTVVFSITATLVAMIIGLPIAWVTERTTLPGKSWVYVIMTLGLLIPGIYTAMGWTFLAHERIGFLNRWAVQLFGLSDAPFNIATPIGMGFVQGMSLAALGFILTAQMFKSMNPSLEEAAGIHGLGFLSTLRRITLPLAMPAILAAVIYIVVIGIATFDIPAIIGLGSRVYLLSTYIFQKTNPGDEELAQHGITAALGVMMIAVAILLTWWYSSVLRKGDQYGVVTGKGYRPTLIEIGGWGKVAWGFIALYLIAAKLIPLLLIGYTAFIPYMAPPSAKMFSLMTLEPFLEEMDWGLILRGMKNTFILVITVPAATLVVAFAVSWLIVRSRSKARYLLEFGAFLPHALPEIILAISALLLALFVLKGHRTAIRVGNADRHRLCHYAHQLRDACDQQRATADPQGTRRSRAHIRYFGCQDILENPRSASAPHPDGRLDLVRYSGLSRTDRRCVPGRTRQSDAAGGNLELLAGWRDEPGRWGDACHDRVAHAADSAVLVVRQKIHHGELGVLAFALVTQARGQ